MSSRKQNELKFPRWNDKPDGGRIYYLDIRGKKGWFARYIKETDRNEKTIGFRQEIYNDAGRLAEIHEKFPENKGHRKIEEQS
jgi:hypothetical protein